MKKPIIAIIVAASALGMSNAFATDVTFKGTVTMGTCDLAPNVNGAINNTIDLGTVKVNTIGTAVEFSLKPVNAQSNDCSAVTASGKKADIIWNGPFGSTGLDNQTGSATNTWVKLTAVNSVSVNTDMKSSMSKTEFDASNFLTDGAKFQATLNGGSVAGDYTSVASFSIAYK